MSAETSLIKARGARIELAQVRKEYADSVAVDDVSLVIEPGEFMTLLGPTAQARPPPSTSSPGSPPPPRAR